MSLAYFLMFVLFSFVIFWESVENINDAAHMLGLIDSAMNKLESLENAEYIDQDGKDITPASYDITFQDVSFGYDKRTVLHDVNFHNPTEYNNSDCRSFRERQIYPVQPDCSLL